MLLVRWQAARRGATLFFCPYSFGLFRRRLAILEIECYYRRRVLEEEEEEEGDLWPPNLHDNAIDDLILKNMS